MSLTCVEYYGTGDPLDLIAAVDVPKDMARSWARQIGRLLCKARGRDSLNVVLIDEYGNTIERMIIVK